ncbi:MAG: hypothetical protein LBO03_10505 [Acidaminococcales bacterium]|jgi:hypothetical protein|nr:hypothetical protein [Acidaminococcales bacterium]
MTEKITGLLDEVQDEVFALQFKEADKKLLLLLEGLEPWASELRPDKLPEFNKIMLEVSAARQKADYLLLADLLEYKLRLFAEKAAT